METVIIGPARSGRTTIFNALTGQSAATGDASGGKKQAYLAEVKVPDERLDRIAALYSPKKLTHASVQFRDVPLDYGDDGSLTPAGLSEVRRGDAVTVVIRAFAGDAVLPSNEDSTPLRDFRKVMDSLVFGDYEVAEKRVARLDKEAKRDTREYHVLQQVVARLGSGKPLGSGFIAPDDEKIFAGFGFLTTKPLFLVLNTGEKSLPHDDLLAEAKANGLDVFTIRGDMEMEIAQLDGKDQQDFLSDLGLKEPAKNRFLRHVYATLHLVSFFTVGEDECKAWSIREGTTAVGAAGAIHSDLAKGFIKAEVAGWEDVLAAGEFSATRKSNKLRLEGKEYLVRDGDCLLIKFNL
jgi:ribosome-binding ATPase